MAIGFLRCITSRFTGPIQSTKIFVSAVEANSLHRAQHDRFGSIARPLVGDQGPGIGFECFALCALDTCTKPRAGLKRQPRGFAPSKPRCVASSQSVYFRARRTASCCAHCQHFSSNFRKSMSFCASPLTMLKSETQVLMLSWCQLAVGSPGRSDLHLRV